MQGVDHRFQGRFQDAVLLAAGGEATLYRVRDEWTGRVGALKLAQPDSEETLLHEFDLLSRFRHPCLIRSLDLVRDEEGAGHLLEYVPVVAPGRVWDEGGEEAVWTVLTQALRGLRYLHRRGYVHGDVAPGNVLVWREGDRWRATLGDLGLARSVGSAREGTVRGTLGTLAPEVARGEGCGVEADLYGLAATAVVWLDGKGGWEGVDPREVLQRTAAGEDAPRPARRVGPELQRVLSRLGRGNPAEREAPEWSALRVESRWGPEVAEATVVGIDDRVADFSAWTDGLAGGRVATLALRGRVGTGRKTLLEVLARDLVASGWTALWDLRVEALAAEAAREGKPADPVELARKLGDRFRGRDLVILWPREAGTVELRLLQALVAGRADEEGARTLVTLAEDPADESRSLGWLREETLLRAEELDPPDGASMAVLVEDLFAEEDARPHVSGEGLSPLAALWLKRTKGESAGVADDLDAATRVETSLFRQWEGLDEPARVLLSLLSVSGSGWSEADLGNVLRVSTGEMLGRLESLERLHLLQRSYGSGDPLFRIGDPLVRTVLRSHRAAASLRGLADAIAGTVGRDGVHPRDLDLALWLHTNGSPCEAYLLEAMATANREGRFDEVLAVRSRLEEARCEPSPAIWEQIRLGGQALGKYREELYAVERLLEGPDPGVSLVTLWRRKAEVLAALGLWEESISACTTWENLPDALPEERIQARLQRAENLWQVGQYREAESVYEETEGLLEPQMKDEWLRFAVGRARQAGQAGEKSRQEAFLMLAEEKVGEEECRKDPNYLNSKTFLFLETGRSQIVTDLIRLATQQALETRQWGALVMAEARNSYAALNLGHVHDMRHASLHGLETALALGSERMATRMRNQLGYAEGRLAYFSNALQRFEQSRRFASQQRDMELYLAAERLRCFLAVMGGWSQMLKESSAWIFAAAHLDNDEASGFAEFSLGWFHLLVGSFGESRHWLEASLTRRNRMGARATSAQSEVLLGILSFRENGSAERLRRIAVEDVAANYPLMSPILTLARMEAGMDEPQATMAILDELWARGRHIEFLEWVPLGMRVGTIRDQQEIRKKALSAIQKAADLDDAQLRRQFLGFARIKNALLAIDG